VICKTNPAKINFNNEPSPHQTNKHNI